MLKLLLFIMLLIILHLIMSLWLLGVVSMYRLITLAHLHAREHGIIPKGFYFGRHPKEDIEYTPSINELLVLRIFQTFLLIFFVVGVCAEIYYSYLFFVEFYLR